MLEDLVDFLALLAEELDASIRLELGRDAALTERKKLSLSSGCASQNRAMSWRLVVTSGGLP